MMSSKSGERSGAPSQGSAPWRGSVAVIKRRQVKKEDYSLARALDLEGGGQ